MTTMLTCFNEDLQRFNGRMRFNKQQKQEIIDAIENKIYALGKSFRKLFTPKKREVLDEVAYLLTGSGICTIGTDKLMEKCGIKSRTTVVEAVRAMKESGDILVCRLANNHAGKYVFVLKTHPNFKAIMEQVFHIHSSDEIHTNEHQNEHQNEHLQNFESVGTVSLASQKEKTIFNISSNLLKQDIIHNIEHTIDTEFLSCENEEQEKKRSDEYHSDWQKDVYKLIKNNKDFCPIIHKYASLIALRSSEDYGIGLVYNSLYKMNVQLLQGTSIKNIPAYFVECYSALMKKNSDEKTVKPVINKKPPFPGFYNWLEDRS